MIKHKTLLSDELAEKLFIFFEFFSMLGYCDLISQLIAFFAFYIYTSDKKIEILSWSLSENKFEEKALVLFYFAVQNFLGVFKIFEFFLC